VVGARPATIEAGREEPLIGCATVFERSARRLASPTVAFTALGAAPLTTVERAELAVIAGAGAAEADAGATALELLVLCSVASIDAPRELGAEELTRGGVARPFAGASGAWLRGDAPALNAWLLPAF